MGKNFDNTKLNNTANEVERTVKDLIDYSNHEDLIKENLSGEINTIASSQNKQNKYNYSKKTINIEGVGLTEKVVSENGEIIGRPNKPINIKKKPITLTLTPDLYDEVKKNAASEHRTTSEYLAIIIEDYIRKN